eukprot:TRINITY_DN34_c0_g2_i1.p1 TRINITY_DN34_c0_g2~~TRINITY_DN34_c0_g2_i1.p1  ORF type:complete len:226 (+),score=71.64 TRINITY_DN34_c0_g2_i1:55-678(+)
MQSSTLASNAPAATAYPAGYGDMERAKYGVYDKPADLRLRPWILASAFWLSALGALLIIFTFVQQGDLSNLWGLFISGIIFAGVSIFGYLAATRFSQLAGLYFWLLVGGFAASLAVLIANAANLRSYLNNDCASAGLARDTLACMDLREYHYITYTAFGTAIALTLPPIIIAAGYFWRVCRLYRKEPYEGARHDAYGNRYPVGTSTM